jgi:protein tyrosine phosphatase (PTP) superfamily phosphohydrolase (DUF442 family)
MVSAQKIQNRVEVTPDLTTSGAIAPEAFQGIAQEGYAVIVNLLPPDHREALREEAEIVAAHGMSYVCLPVDFAAPKVDDFRQFVELMRRWEGQRMWIHCAANYRVTTFVALYGRLRWNWDDSAALRFAKQLWEPNATWRAFYELLCTHGCPEASRAIVTARREPRS